MPVVLDRTHNPRMQRAAPWESNKPYALARICQCPSVRPMRYISASDTRSRFSSSPGSIGSDERVRRSTNHSLSFASFASVARLSPICVASEPEPRAPKASARLSSWRQCTCNRARSKGPSPRQLNLRRDLAHTTGPPSLQRSRSLESDPHRLCCPRYSLQTCNP